MNKVLWVMLVLNLVNCHQDSPAPDATGYACGKVISKRLLAITVPIHYSKELDSYYISSSSSTVDTLTNREISVFCDLPNAYKAEGKILKFDASFAQLYDTIGTAGLIKRAFKTKYANYLAIDKIY